MGLAGSAARYASISATCGATGEGGGGAELGVDGATDPTVKVGKASVRSGAMFVSALEKSGNERFPWSAATEVAEGMCV